MVFANLVGIPFQISLEFVSVYSIERLLKLPDTDPSAMQHISLVAGEIIKLYSVQTAHWLRVRKYRRILWVCCNDFTRDAVVVFATNSVSLWWSVLKVDNSYASEE